MHGPWTLPADVREGDWIEIRQLGAYGTALRTAFNGFDRALVTEVSMRRRCSRPPDMAARRPSAPPDARNAPTMKHAAFDGRLVMLGFGSIGQGVLPLILRHIDMPRERIEIVTADDRGAAIAAGHGVAHTVRPLTRENHAAVLRGKLSKGDLLLNLSVDVSSVALVALCREIGALYLDTCVEPGPAAIPTPRSPSRSGPTMRCGKARSH